MAKRIRTSNVAQLCLLVSIVITVASQAFKLKKRQDKYAKGSAAYAGVQEVIDQAKDTAKAYEGRWCGKKDFAKLCTMSCKRLKPTRGDVSNATQ
eukprot:773131-Amphidinium_carterae.1